MRQTIPYFIAAGLVVMVVFKFDPLRAPEPAPQNVYDSTLLILRDLVDNDPRLGFANSTEAAHAWIDLSAGLSYVYLSEDTLLANDLPLASKLKSMHRIVYPVYTTVNGNTKLCASITFDSVGGVHPVVFDDSMLIIPFLKHRASVGGTAANYSMIEMPFLFTHAVIAHDSSGGQIVSTPELRAALGEEYDHSETDTTNGVIHLPDEDFLDAVKDAAN